MYSLMTFHPDLFQKIWLEKSKFVPEAITMRSTTTLWRLAKTSTCHRWKWPTYSMNCSMPHTRLANCNDYCKLSKHQWNFQLHSLYSRLWDLALPISRIIPLHLSHKRRASRLGIKFSCSACHRFSTALMRPYRSKQSASTICQT